MKQKGVNDLLEEGGTEVVFLKKKSLGVSALNSTHESVPSKHSVVRLCSSFMLNNNNTIGGVAWVIMVCGP